MSKSKSSIFDWIRAVSASTIKLAVKGTALELIPLIDNQTMTTDLTIQQAARSMSGDSRTIRRHRRALIDAGFLEDSAGWILTLNTENLSPVKFGRTEHKSPDKFGRTEQTSPDKDDRSIIITALIDSISDPRARKDSTKQQPGKSPKLEDLPNKWRPDVKTRKPTNTLGAEQLDHAWNMATGAAFGWPRWSAIVAPYLTADELAELARVGSSSPRPNLPFLASVASRIIRQANNPKHKRRQTAYNGRISSRQPETCSGTLDALSGYLGESDNEF